MNLCVVVHSFIPVSSPARPVQKLLSEQSRLVVLGDAPEHRPAGTPLSPPEDTDRDLVQCLTLQGTHSQYDML